MRSVFVAAAFAACWALAVSAQAQEIFWTDTLGRSVYTAF